MASDNIMDKVNDILNNPDAMEKISSILGSDLGSASGSTPAFDTNSVEKITKLASKINESDPKINLLNALKPYMNSSRTSHIDKAIKMIQMTKITSLFKDF